MWAPAWYNGVSKVGLQTIASKFDSHWEPHTSALVQNLTKLSKWLLNYCVCVCVCLSELTNKCYTTCMGMQVKNQNKELLTVPGDVILKPDRKLGQRRLCNQVAFVSSTSPTFNVFLEVPLFLQVQSTH